MVENVNLGLGTNIILGDLVNIYGCTIGDRTTVGPFVEIQSNVSIGEDCKIQSHSFICSGVEIGDRVFIGHGAMFCNDKNPRIALPNHEIEGVVIKDDAVIGSGAVILPGVTIGVAATVGAGSVVTKDVPDWTIVIGNPAKRMRR